MITDIQNQTSQLIKRYEFGTVLNNLLLGESLKFYPHIDGVFCFNAERVKIGGIEYVIVYLQSKGNITKNVMFREKVDMDEVINLIMEVEHLCYDSFTHFKYGMM